MTDKETVFISSSSSFGINGNPLSRGVSSRKQQMVIVVSKLPLIDEKGSHTEWKFSQDRNAATYHLMEVMKKFYEVTLIGLLDVPVSFDKRDTISLHLLAQYGYIPIFSSFKNTGMKKLWDLYHGIHPTSLNDTLSTKEWKTYIRVNSLYTNKIEQAMKSKNCFFWVEGYNLILLPNLIRKKNSKSRILFKFDTPFPTLETFRTMSFGEEMIRGVLGADLITFCASVHGYNFLSTCDKMLRLQYRSHLGNLELPCDGRIIKIRVVPVMINFATLKQLAKGENDLGKVGLSGKDSEGKKKMVLKNIVGTEKVILSIDHLSSVSEIQLQLKLLAVEKFLEQSIAAVFIQIIIVSDKLSGIERELIDAIEEMKGCINLTYGGVECKPFATIYHVHEIMPQERTIYYKCADCLLITAVRDVMYLSPFEFTLFGKGCDIVISENLTCSLGLNGVARVNPWNIKEVSDALLSVLKNPRSKTSEDHKRNIEYVKMQDMDYIVPQLMDDVHEQCKEHESKIGHGYGVGLKSRVVLLSNDEGKVDVAKLAQACMSAKNRLFLLDIDDIGPLKADLAIRLACILSHLTRENNKVFIFSKLSEQKIPDWVNLCGMVGMVIEDGFLRRSCENKEWKILEGFENLSWYTRADSTLKTFARKTNFTFVEKKQSAFVWHLESMEPHLASSVFKDLEYQLKNVFLGGPVIGVEYGKGVLEVKPEGMNKMAAAQRITMDMIADGVVPDFVLCIGFDAYKENLMDCLHRTMPSSSIQATVHKIRVGLAPDKAGCCVGNSEELVDEVLASMCCLI